MPPQLPAAGVHDLRAICRQCIAQHFTCGFGDRAGGAALPCHLPHLWHSTGIWHDEIGIGGQRDVHGVVRAGVRRRDRVAQPITRLDSEGEVRLTSGPSAPWLRAELRDRTLPLHGGRTELVVELSNEFGDWIRPHIEPVQDEIWAKAREEAARHLLAQLHDLGLLL